MAKRNGTVSSEVAKWAGLITCYRCKHKYSKDMTFVCPYFVGSIVPDGYCWKGEADDIMDGTDEEFLDMLKGDLK